MADYKWWSLMSKARSSESTRAAGENFEKVGCKQCKNEEKCMLKWSDNMGVSLSLIKKTSKKFRYGKNWRSKSVVDHGENFLPSPPLVVEIFRGRFEEKNFNPPLMVVEIFWSTTTVIFRKKTQFFSRCVATLCRATTSFTLCTCQN